jgi:protein TonB
MAHTLGIRATSLGASAAVLGLAVVAAFSVSVRFIEFNAVVGPTIDVFAERPKDDPPLRPITRDRPPPTTTTEEPVITDIALADPQPLQISEFSSLVTTYEGPPEITSPRWLQRPRDLGIYYPRRAEARGVTGDVVLDCLVSPAGRLDCDVVSETPSNWGFGEAALAISRDHRMAPATREGVVVQGRYRMRVPFQVR